MQIAAQPERKRLHERLRSRIDVAARIRIIRRDRRDIDDRAATGDQPGQQFVGERSERRHIRVDHRFPLGEIGGLRGIAAKREPGVVDEEVDAAKSVGKRGQSRVARRFIGDVEGGGMDLVGADGGDQGLKSFGPAARRDDAPSRGRERAGGGFADARGRASDESRPAHAVPLEQPIRDIAPARPISRRRVSPNGEARSLYNR